MNTKRNKLIKGIVIFVAILYAGSYTLHKISYDSWYLLPTSIVVIIAAVVAFFWTLNAFDNYVKSFRN